MVVDFKRKTLFQFECISWVLYLYVHKNQRSQLANHFIEVIRGKIMGPIELIWRQSAQQNFLN